MNSIKIRRKIQPGRRKTRASGLAEPAVPRSKPGKIIEKNAPKENETYRIFQALLLALSVLVLSYHGLRHGRTAYSVLENGQIVKGFVSARRAVITFSLGYSVFYSCLSAVAACMMLYSLVSVSSLSNQSILHNHCELISFIFNITSINVQY